MPESTFLHEQRKIFHQAGRDFESLVEGVEAETARRQPAPGSWSVAECLEHLNATERQYAPRMKEAIEGGREKGIRGSGPFTRKTLLGRLLLGMLDPSKPRKVPAPKVFMPAAGSGLDFEQVCRDFRAGLERFEGLATGAEGLDLDRIRLATPVMPWPKMTLAEAFRLQALHIPRHLKQARAALGVVSGG